MRLQLSIRAMLLGLFGAAIIAALGLAAVALLSNARLVTTQDYILDEVMPSQVARSEVSNVMAGFGARHSELLAADSKGDLDEITSLEELQAAYRQASAEFDQMDAEARQLADSLDSGYQELVAADRRLERARTRYLERLEQIQARVATMDEKIGEVMVASERMAGRAVLRRVRQERELRQELERVGGDTRELAPGLIEALVEKRLDVVSLSNDIRIAVAQLA
ncbi:MAG: hypothetical protein R6V11_02595, partial [Ectothiorhodospiraceae bacterium]